MVNPLIMDLRKIADGLPEDTAKWPHIPCPTCKRGSLVVSENSLVKEETNISQSWHNDPDWDPDWYQGAFHCVLQCKNPSCNLVRLVGETDLTIDFDPQEGPFYTDRFTPALFFPALPLLQSHNLCPEPVQIRIDAAAKVLWGDPSSAANRLRSATESLMDDQGIIRKGLNKKKETIDFTLHRRIELFKVAKPEFAQAADLILAVKWLGNVGSHDSVLTIHEVLRGAEILDYALELIYDDSREKLLKEAAEITARKGQPQRFTANVPF